MEEEWPVPNEPRMSTDRGKIPSVPWLVPQSAETDCVGFVQRSAGYDGNPYELFEIGASSGNNGEHPWTYNEGDAIDYVVGRQIMYYSGDPYYTNDPADKNDPDKEYKSYPPNLNKITDHYEVELSQEMIGKILPGDIFYYSAGYHVGIVDRIEYEGCDIRSEIRLADIKIIEATWATVSEAFANVINNRSLAYYSTGDNRKSWRIGRLQQE